MLLHKDGVCVETARNWSRASETGGYPLPIAVWTVNTAVEKQYFSRVCGVPFMTDAVSDGQLLHASQVGGLGLGGAGTAAAGGDDSTGTGTGPEDVDVSGFGFGGGVGVSSSFEDELQRKYADSIGVGHPSLSPSPARAAGSGGAGAARASPYVRFNTGNR